MFSISQTLVILCRHFLKCIIRFELIVGIPFFFFEEYPDYYEVIKNPVDLNRIFKRMQGHGTISSYTGVEDMVADFVQMFDNACRFNESDSLIYKVRGYCGISDVFNTLRPSDAIWRHRSGSTLAQVMACCLTAPSHYLNQC